MGERERKRAFFLQGIDLHNFYRKTRYDGTQKQSLESNAIGFALLAFWEDMRGVESNNYAIGNYIYSLWNETIIHVFKST